MTVSDFVDSLALHDGPDVLAKRGKLADFVREILARHDHRFRQSGRVAENADVRIYDGADDRERRQVMGSPARYAEVTWREYSDTPETIERIGGDLAETSHTFLVSVFWGDGDGAEDDFARALESLDPTRPGLLAALKSTSYLPTDPGTLVVEVGEPDRVAVVLAAPRPSAKGRERTEFQAAFTIRLT